MRIYSSKLTAVSVMNAFAAARQIADADIWADGPPRPFTPRNGYAYGTEVYARSLHGTRMSGRNVSYRTPAASWDAWGWVIAYLYAQDPDAKISWYDGRDDFITKVEAYGAHRREPSDFLALVRDVPAAAAAYFTRHRGLNGAPAGHPDITSSFTPARGWCHFAPVPVSTARLTRMRQDGISAVALSAGGRHVDFTMTELLPA